MHRVLMEPYQILQGLSFVLEEEALEYFRHNKNQTTDPQVMPSEFQYGLRIRQEKMETMKMNNKVIKVKDMLETVNKQV